MNEKVGQEEITFFFKYITRAFRLKARKDVKNLTTTVKNSERPFEGSNYKKHDLSAINFSVIIGAEEGHERRDLKERGGDVYVCMCLHCI